MVKGTHARNETDLRQDVDMEQSRAEKRRAAAEALSL
jgi:hypothetical protein